MSRDVICEIHENFHVTRYTVTISTLSTWFRSMAKFIITFIN